LLAEYAAYIALALVLFYFHTVAKMDFPVFIAQAFIYAFYGKVLIADVVGDRAQIVADFKPFAGLKRKACFEIVPEIELGFRVLPCLGLNFLQFYFQHGFVVDFCNREHFYFLHQTFGVSIIRRQAIQPVDDALVGGRITKHKKRR